MRAIFRINAEQYTAIYEEFASANKTDYYIVGDGMYNRIQFLSDEQYGAALRSPALSRFIQDNDLNNGQYAHLNHGYTITETGAMYRTCRGNSWGVYLTGNQAWVFYEGRRSRAYDIPLFDVLKDKIPEIHKSDMSKYVPSEIEAMVGLKWYETLHEFKQRAYKHVDADMRKAHAEFFQ